MNKTFGEFKAFLLKGNVVDLAVAVVIGAAFGGIVTALVKDIITPIIAAIGGQPDFGGLSFTINGSHFLYGDFINTVVNFVIVAAAIFFLVVKPMQHIIDLRKTDEPVAQNTRQCPECLSMVAAKAHKCAYCTSVLEPVAIAPTSN